VKAGNIAIVYAKELRDLLRDRRTLRSIVFMPLVMMPLMVLLINRATHTITTSANAEVYPIQILGGADSPNLVAQLSADPRLRIKPATDDWQQLIDDKKIRAAVLIPDHFESDLRTGPGAPVTIYIYKSEFRSEFAANEIEGFFVRLSNGVVQRRLAEHGLPPTLTKPFVLQRENVAPPAKVAGNRIGGLVPYLIVILCFTGALYPAIDLTAGEKERGTMETLLCSPLARLEIVLGKFFMVLSCSLAAVVLSCISLFISFRLGGPNSSTGANAVALGLTHVDPAGMAGVLVMILPVAVLFSAVVLTLGLWARSTREAMSYVAPMMLIIIVPAVIGMLPGIDLNARYALVPILNLSLACREILSGEWHWPYLAIIFASMSAYAAIALAVAVRMFNREAVVFRT
jgi:sodium transport system permease protein